MCWVEPEGVVLWIHIVPRLWQAVPAEGVFSWVTGVPTALWFVTVAPCIAGFGILAQGAALRKAEGLTDAFLALDCVCIHCNHLICLDIALESMAVLCSTACKGRAELCCASAVALEVLGAVDVACVGRGAGPLLWLPLCSSRACTCTHSSSEWGN